MVDDVRFPCSMISVGEDSLPCKNKKVEKAFQIRSRFPFLIFPLPLPRRKKGTYNS